MKEHKYSLYLAIRLIVLAVATLIPKGKVSASGDEGQFIAVGSMLDGLASGAAFPFIDTTPHRIAVAHIAVTDATTNCSAGAAAPPNVQVPVAPATLSFCRYIC